MYKLLYSRFNLPVGTVVYEYKGSDHGYCKDAEISYGIPYLAVSLYTDIPDIFFTVPTHYLETL